MHFQYQNFECFVSGKFTEKHRSNCTVVSDIILIRKFVPFFALNLSYKTQYLIDEIGIYEITSTVKSTVSYRASELIASITVVSILNVKLIKMSFTYVVTWFI